MSHVRRRPSSPSRALVAVVSAAVLAIGAAPRARADEPAPVPGPAPAPVVPAPTPVEPLRNDDLAVPDVLRQLSRLTGAVITWSDQDKVVNGRRIFGAGPVLRSPPGPLFDAVRALLANEEILLVPYGPLAARMYRAMDARLLMSGTLVKAQPEVIEITDEMIPVLLGQGGRYVSTLVRVNNLTELREARSALARLVTQSNVGSVQEVLAARAFVVTDFAPNVAAIYRVVRQMDVAPAAPEAPRAAPAYFVLRHAGARAVSNLLERLFPAKPAGPSAPAPRSSPDGSAPAAPLNPAPRISYDEDTNQVIVIATPEDTAVIRDIVRNVDVAPPK